MKRGPLTAGESVLLIDKKSRQYLRRLRPDRELNLRGGKIQAGDIIGLPEGSVIESTKAEPFFILRPSFAQLIPHLPRNAQVIYPKDIGPILLWGDIFPGARVIEVGTGPGALSMGILRAIGTEGQLVSYEIRPDFAEMAMKNVAQFLGDTPNWCVKIRDATLGFDEQEIDRLTIDLAEPWGLLPQIATTLRPGGIVVAYSPTILQVKAFTDAVHTSPHFTSAECFETMHRTWHIKKLSVRPDHRMVAHTGFITTARRNAVTSP